MPLEKESIARSWKNTSAHAFAPRSEHYCTCICMKKTLERHCAHNRIVNFVARKRSTYKLCRVPTFLVYQGVKLYPAASSPSSCALRDTGCRQPTEAERNVATPRAL